MLRVPSRSDLRRLRARIPSWAIVLSIAATIGAIAAATSVMLIARSRGPSALSIPSEEVSD